MTRPGPARGLLAILILIGLGLTMAPPATSSADPTTAGTIRPVVGCTGLTGHYPVPGAETTVEKAEPVTPADGAPAYCDVHGVIRPAVRFQLKLPISTYQGRYLQYGCGGFCGTVWPPQFARCAGPSGGDEAVATTDDGHVADAQQPEGQWGRTSQAARDDWAFRAPHVLSVAAKRLISAYYGTPPTRSYFGSCSNGGREGLLLAQRYPHDFDGILVGAPAAYAGPQFGVYFGWMARANLGPGGEQLLTEAELPVLHRAAVARCDGVDGLIDGQIDDPRRCRFDPAVVRCRTATKAPDCLSAEQVRAARKMYAGPTDEHGRRLFPGAQSPGSELAWAGWQVATPGFGSISASLADGYLRYLGYPIGTPHSSLSRFEFTAREFHRLTAEGRRANAMRLDLGEFSRAGGKLLLWHGWDDTAVPATATLDYYQRLADRNGGPKAVRDWARAFVVPTMYHCGGGYALTGFDPLAALVTWVEAGRAPDRIVATGQNQSGQPRTRPVFPYPLEAKYDGSGSIDDAANFVPVAPRPRPSDRIRWIGEYLHDVPGPVG